MNKDRLGKHISIIYRYSQIYFNEHLKKYNLGSGQYIFLLHLIKNNGITQEELSVSVKFDKATTARAVAKLIDGNYVERKVCETDKRAYNLYTTDKAESIKDGLFAVLDSWNQIMLEELTLKDRQLLLGLLEKVGNHVANRADKRHSSNFRGSD